METRLAILGRKAAVVLFQLPARFTKDPARLDAFPHMLPADYRYAFEFGHRSWYADDVLGLLQTHDAALCFSDHADAPAPWDVTARHAYVRGQAIPGAIAAAIPQRRCAAGRRRSPPGGRRGGRSSSISTMTGGRTQGCPAANGRRTSRRLQRCL
jgi:Protein of unknown function DUF72